MINQKHFLYVLQNKKHFTTFSADVKQFPNHQKFIEELNWNILSDFNNYIVKNNLFYDWSILLNKKRFLLISNNPEETLNRIMKEYNK